MDIPCSGASEALSQRQYGLEISRLRRQICVFEIAINDRPLGSRFRDTHATPMTA